MRYEEMYQKTFVHHMTRLSPNKNWAQTDVNFIDIEFLLNTLALPDLKIDQNASAWEKAKALALYVSPHHKNQTEERLFVNHFAEYLLAPAKLLKKTAIALAPSQNHLSPADVNEIIHEMAAALHIPVALVQHRVEDIDLFIEDKGK